MIAVIAQGQDIPGTSFLMAMKSFPRLCPTMTMFAPSLTCSYKGLIPLSLKRGGLYLTPHPPNSTHRNRSGRLQYGTSSDTPKTKGFDGFLCPLLERMEKIRD